MKLTSVIFVISFLGPRKKNTEDASEESVTCNGHTKEQSIEI